jgi:hypothetical protein
MGYVTAIWKSRIGILCFRCGPVPPALPSVAAAPAERPL